jgi:hypothetical protein
MPTTWPQDRPGSMPMRWPVDQNTVCEGFWVTGFGTGGLALTGASSIETALIWVVFMIGIKGQGLMVDGTLCRSPGTRRAEAKPALRLVAAPPCYDVESVISPRPCSAARSDASAALLPFEPVTVGFATGVAPKQPMSAWVPSVPT